MSLPTPWRERVVVANLSSRPTEIAGVPLVRPLLLLRDAGYAVHIVSREPVPGRSTVEGITIWSETNLGSLARRVMGLRPELLWVESITYGVILEPLARRSWIRNPLPASDPRLQRLQRALIPRFDAITITDPSARSRWRYDADRMIDLPYPVDLAWWSEPQERDPGWWGARGLPVPEGPVLVCISAYARGKRVVELVEMLAPWLRERPQAILVLVGHQFVDAEVTEQLGTVPAALAIDRQVVVTGWMPAGDIRQLLAWAAASIVNTAAETQCLAVYESLAAGVPALISAIPVLTSQFPTLPAHQGGPELLTNLDRLLAEPGARGAMLATTSERLVWADVARHDKVFAEGVERLLGRSLSR
jgi:glycosyltransferase involved in cell wall biosynthesis